MPQLDIADFAPQLIWLAITFIGLYLLMARVALPSIGGIIEQRRDRIASDLDEAARLKEQTDKAIAEYEAALAEARANAGQIFQQRREEMKAEADRQLSELDAKLSAKIAEAEKRITKARNAARTEIKKVAAETAGLIVEELIGKAPAKRKITSAVSAAAKAN